ncbi:hypothetical protein H3146_03990 [Streptomyces sp. OF3]|uniref:Uncharacterized protein n=1 Tax=Streptomyces alkaliterrae TaxID=2213162 RepID=A0A7W3ZLL3_9ACTN|nr:hypothetical protein [Streptomyces alkaliterrae]MBB1252536.1 hypothetical protein [Streptomyces alkaliterrae]
MDPTFQTAVGEAAQALHEGRWNVSRADVAAAGVLWQELWLPFRDVLEAEVPDPARIRQRLAAVPEACAAAQVPGIDARFAEALRRAPEMTALEIDQAVQALGHLGVLVHAVGTGPEMSV